MTDVKSKPKIPAPSPKEKKKKRSPFQQPRKDFRTNVQYIDIYIYTVFPRPR